MYSITHKMRVACRLAVVVVLMACFAAEASAQRVALKTNALYWAAATPNVGLELRVNRHVTFNFEGAVNRLKVGKYNTRGKAFTPELRYWFSARPQTGHFIGIMGAAVNYNVLVADQHHDGDIFGGGLTYGYSFVLGRHWSLEATLGGGIGYRREQDYNGLTEPRPVGMNVKKWQVLPLKAGVSFVYIIK